MATWDSDKGPSDTQVDDALQVLRAEYWTSIRGMAKDLVRRVDEGEFDTDKSMQDNIHEDVDSCHWVIYTHANYKALLCSDADAFELAHENFGMTLNPNDSMVSASLAYCVVRHDLEEQVQAELGGTVEEYLQAKNDEA